MSALPGICGNERAGYLKRYKPLAQRPTLSEFKPLGFNLLWGHHIAHNDFCQYALEVYGKLGAVHNWTN